MIEPENKEYPVYYPVFPIDDVNLPNVNTARIFEPKPGTVYHW